MNMLDLIDRLADRNGWFTATIIMVYLIWLVARRVLRDGSVASLRMRVLASIDLLLTPLALICLGSLAKTVLTWLDVAGLAENVGFLVHLSVFLSIAWFVAHFFELWILSRSRYDVGTYQPGLERGLLFGGMLFLGLLAFLAAKGYSITGLYVSTGAVAAVVAFAMQRTLGDLFSGIALSIEHPFRLGEWIELEDGRQGQVIDINWRATRLRAWDNTTLVIPNGALAAQGFKNLHGSNHRFSPWYEIKVPAEVDPRFAKALLLDAALKCRKIQKMPLPVVRLIDASTVPYTYMVWVHFPNYISMFAGREELFREIHHGFKKAGIQPSPMMRHHLTRTVEATMAEPPTPLLAMKALDIGALLEEDELAKLVSKSVTNIYDAGSVILNEGVIAPGVDIITSGVVETSIMTPQGTVKPIDQLVPGEYFGIASMLTNVPSFLKFTALTDATLIRIDMNCLRSVLAERKDLSEAFAKLVEQRIERANQVRRETKKPSMSFSFQDILRRIEKSLH
ncbi:MAG: mechanosensitive ion channel domain-containing protein [Geminicoccales bacterium]